MLEVEIEIPAVKDSRVCIEKKDTAMKCLLLTCIVLMSSAFQVPHSIRRSTVPCNDALASQQNDSEPKTDNKAMAFLRKIGKVGGSLNQVTNLVGVDEGPAGKASTGGMKVSTRTLDKSCNHWPRNNSSSNPLLRSCLVLGYSKG